MIIIVVVLFAVLIGIFFVLQWHFFPHLCQAPRILPKKTHNFQMTWCAFCVFHAYLRFGLFVYKQKAKQMLRFCKQIWLFNKTNSTYECSNNENTRNYVKDNEKEMQKKRSKTYESRIKTCSNSQHRKLFKWLKTKVHISQWRNNNHHTLVACPSRIRIGSE